MMAERYLPIQFFEKRKDFDDRLTEGGGDSKLPSWTLSGEALSHRATKLVSDIDTLTDNLQSHKATGKKLPMVVATKIEDNAIAKSHRGDISALFADRSNSNILGFYGNRCLLSIVEDEDVLHRITRTLSNKEEQAKLISSISGIEVFAPEITSYDDECSFYKVRLLNYNNFDMNRAIKILFEQQCKEKGIIIERITRYTQDMTIYRVSIDSAEELSLLGDLEGVYNIEQLIPVTVSLDALAYQRKVSPKEPDPSQEYPVVGILDTGIADNAFLTKWKEPNSFTSYPEVYQDSSHGTFVASVIEYGDELNESNYTVLSGVRLFEAIVYPDEKKQSIYPDELIDQIREAVERNRNIKVWNLSLGTTSEASLSEFSDFGMALDSIQDENNVLIVKSAGNCTNFMSQTPKSRISKSADSIRALVVGSLAHAKGQFDYANIDEPSPFTRVGPGPSNIIKPDLVFYGGNAGIYNGKLVTTGVPVIAPDGTIAQMPGTSFSTPRVTRIAAELAFLMKEEFDPLLIRALMIHNAKYPANCPMDMSEKVAQMGFGMPPSVSEILYNSADEITLILRDTLDRGSFIEMFDFPYPTSLVDENGFYKGQITVTLVTKSLVDDKQAGEYCQSHIDIAFGTYETERSRDTSKKTVKNPKGLEEPQNLLLDSLYTAQSKKAYPMTAFERECVLVQYGKKFHPVKKYAADLLDMTPANRRKYLGQNRKWYLKIQGLFRDFIEQDAIARQYQLSQEYCLILTIRDPDGQAPVYDEVAQQLDVKNFAHHNIQLRNTINVDAE